MVSVLRKRIKDQVQPSFTFGTMKRGAQSKQGLPIFTMGGQTTDRYDFCHLFLKLKQV
jgi:hypothetical protein